MTPFVWEADPVLLRIGALQVHWYGILFAAAFLGGLVLVRWMLAREGKPLDVLDRLLVLGLLGALIGARLGHVLFYRTELFVQNPAEVLAIWHGGLASHGGAVGLLVGLWLAIRNRPEIPYLWLLDRVAPAAALGGALIRIGNFLNSELIGRPAEIPWAVVFARVDPIPRHPVQLYEAAAYLGVFLLLLAIYRTRTGRLAPGFMLGLFLVAVFGARFLLEYVKVPPEPFELPVPLTMGQLLSVPMVMAGILLLWRVARRVGMPDGRARKPDGRAGTPDGRAGPEGGVSRSAPPSRRKPRPRRRRP